MHENVELRLKRLCAAAPPPELGHRIMYAARAEALRYTAWDRVWNSRLFWRSIAAATVIAFILRLVPLSGWPSGGPSLPQPDPRAAAFAKTLADMAGYGPTAARRFALQLSGPPAAGPSARRATAELLETLEWQE